MKSVELLRKLISFPTVSSDSNLALIMFVADLLSSHGIEYTILPSSDGRKANLYARVGPKGVPGVILSGHTDVVPVEGQSWLVPPFSMTEDRGRLYGRGAADMKGFVACAVTACLNASAVDLKTPLQLALSYDEEVGCVGVHSLLGMLSDISQRPVLCIVGEPTELQVATGHKGKVAVRAMCHGREGHSALAPLALNAIHLGCDFISALREEQLYLSTNGASDPSYDIPYSTVHVGIIKSGFALNIVPSLCEIDFEIRHVAGDDPAEIMRRINLGAQRITTDAKTTASEAAITIDVINSYPGLETPKDIEAVAFVKSLIGSANTIKVAFGTEGGLFSHELGTPTIVCGPGSMLQGHKPDEYISIDQMRRCDQMLENLLKRLATGL